MPARLQATLFLTKGSRINYLHYKGDSISFIFVKLHQTYIQGVQKKKIANFLNFSYSPLHTVVDVQRMTS